MGREIEEEWTEPKNCVLRSPRRDMGMIIDKGTSLLTLRGLNIKKNVNLARVGGLFTLSIVAGGDDGVDGYLRGQRPHGRSFAYDNCDWGQNSVIVAWINALFMYVYVRYFPSIPLQPLQHLERARNVLIRHKRAPTAHPRRFLAIWISRCKKTRPR